LAFKAFQGIKEEGEEKRGGVGGVVGGSIGRCEGRKSLDLERYA